MLAGTGHQTAFSHRRARLVSSQRHTCNRSTCRAAGSDEGSVSPLRGVVYTSIGDTPAPPTFPLPVALLSFMADEVLLPGGVKTLHLYEARYLALLEELLASQHKLFAHVVVEPVPSPAASSEAAQAPMALVCDNAVLLMGTLVRVLEVKAMSVGALVRIQAEARVGVTELQQVSPFMRGEVKPLTDEAVGSEGAAAAVATALELEGVMKDALNLAMKFGGTETAVLQKAMLWCNSSATPLCSNVHPGDSALETACRLSFAALQVLPEATAQEQARLLQVRWRAMTTLSLQQRLETALEVMSDARAMLCAKIALKALSV